MTDPIPERLVRARFLEVKDNLDQVIYSLFRSKEPGLTDELYLRIKEEGGGFADLAHYSDGPESKTQGIIGPCPISKAHPEIATRLKSLQIGQLKPPFLFKHWSVLLRVEERLPARYQDWEDMIRQVLIKERQEA